jgi:hypothetical protein
VVEFIETNHNPSRHRIEEHDMLNWVKSTRKKDECVGVESRGGKELLELCEKNKHKNQRQ